MLLRRAPTGAQAAALTDGGATALHGHFPYVAKANGENLAWEYNNVVSGAGSTVNIAALTAADVGKRMIVTFAGTVGLTIQLPASTNAGNGSAAGTIVFGVAEEAGEANVTLQATSTTHLIVVGEPRGTVNLT